MKKILAVFGFCLLGVCPAFTQPGRGNAVQDGAGTSDMLAWLSGNIAALGDYRVEFSVDADGYVMAGNYIVSGRKFRISTPEFEVVGDGTARYEVNHELREVIIDVMDTTDINVLVNPTRAFEFAESGFTAVYAGGVSGSGDIALELTSVDEESAIVKIKLFVKRDTGLPSRLEYSLEGLDEKISVSVTSFRRDDNIKPADFRFDKSKYKGYEIVDFR